MHLVKALALAVGSWTASLFVAFALLVLTASLGGRGTARLSWLLPLHVALLAIVYGVAVVVFHVVARPWISTTVGRWLATGLVASGYALTFVAAVLATLVVLDR